ncbi:MAG: hypothetical protein GY811_30930 [Myxococcales bacterium]|nr:hypothetical protein [Myxococcales bacterium]
MTRFRSALLGTAIAASAASTLNPDSVPEVDDCDQALNATVEVVTLVQPDADEEMQDYEVHDLIYGSQGGTMVRLRFGVTGTDAPACMGVTLKYEKCLDCRAQTMIGLMVLLSRLQRCSFRHLPRQNPHSRLALEESELTTLCHSFRSTV